MLQCNVLPLVKKSDGVMPSASLFPFPIWFPEHVFRRVRNLLVDDSIIRAKLPIFYCSIWIMTGSSMAIPTALREQKHFLSFNTWASVRLLRWWLFPISLPLPPFNEALLPWFTEILSACFVTFVRSHWRSTAAIEAYFTSISCSSSVKGYQSSNLTLLTVAAIIQYTHWMSSILALYNNISSSKDSGIVLAPRALKLERCALDLVL